MSSLVSVSSNANRKPLLKSPVSKLVTFLHVLLKSLGVKTGEFVF